MKTYHLSQSTKKKALASAAVSALAYLLFIFFSDSEKIVKIIISFGISGVYTALALSLINYFLRFGRWQLHTKTLNLSHKIHWQKNLKVYFCGFAFTATPGKAGELIRSFLLKKHDISYSSSVSLFIGERVSDLTAISLLALLGFSTYTETSIAIALLLTVVLGTILLYLFYPLLSNSRRNKYSKIVKESKLIISNIKAFNKPQIIAISIPLSLIAWSAEAYALFYCLQIIGHEISFATAAAVYAISMIVGAISFLPGGIGSSEATMVSLLVLSNIELHDALAVTLFIRLATLWFAVGIGATTLYLSKEEL